MRHLWPILLRVIPVLVLLGLVLASVIGMIQSRYQPWLGLFIALWLAFDAFFIPLIGARFSRGLARIVESKAGEPSAVLYVDSEVGSALESMGSDGAIRPELHDLGPHGLGDIDESEFREGPTRAWSNSRGMDEARGEDININELRDRVHIIERAHWARKPREGIIAWNPPARMRVGRKETIEVRLADGSVDLAGILETLRGKNATLSGNLEVGSRMRVQLIADPKDFHIRGLASQDQALLPGKIARWDFDVTPKRRGKRTLRLLVTIRLLVESRDEVVDLPSYEHEVLVAIAPIYSTGRFLAANWQWVGATIAVPLIAWVLVGSGLAGKAIHWLGGPPAAEAGNPAKPPQSKAP